MRHFAWLLAFCVMGCSGGTGNNGADTNAANVDTGPSQQDSGGSMSDAGPTTYPDGALVCRAGVECTNWAAALSAAMSLNGAAGGTPDAALQNCVIQLHQSDCCGARRAYGFNHAARMQLCTAETSCTMQYPSPAGCTSTAITVDTGDTTMDATQVRLRVVNPMSCMFGTCYTCETFVCTDASCMSAPTIMPRQCG